MNLSEAKDILAEHGYKIINEYKYRGKTEAVIDSLRRQLQQERGKGQWAYETIDGIIEDANKMTKAQIIDELKALSRHMGNIPTIRPEDEKLGTDHIGFIGGRVPDTYGMEFKPR
jgi:hypothetical protein